MITLKWNKGKSKGSTNIAEMARTTNIAEGTLRSRETRRPDEFNLLHMGAVCKANNISLKDLTRYIEDRDDNK